MTKPKRKFFCDACGYESVKWMGRCPGCGEFDSMVEAPEASLADPGSVDRPAPLVSIRDVVSTEHRRIASGWGEVDRVLGGGLVPGSLTLLGGEPGIGKSTLLLSLCLRAAGAGHRCVYVAAEESASQVRMRADRVSRNGLPAEFLVCESSDLPAALLAASSAALVVIDSIQTVRIPTLRSISGSVLQIRESVFRIQEAAKHPAAMADSGPAFILVGHITKGGEIAGPKLLEHMVDTVLSFEGDRQMGLRFLRAQKNRFGSTQELGVFDMGGEGLIEIPDPGAIFRSSGDRDLPGVAVASLVEGSRAFLVEIQSLTQEVNLAMPRRVATGVDSRRLLSILAVLEKRVGLKLGTCDVFLSAVGGFVAKEPSADLAVAMAVASAARHRPIPKQTVFAGEVTLTGELRSPTSVARRVAEAARLGYREIVLPVSQARPSAAFDADATPNSIDISSCRDIVDCVKKYLV